MISLRLILAQTPHNVSSSVIYDMVDHQVIVWFWSGLVAISVIGLEVIVVAWLLIMAGCWLMWYVGCVSTCSGHRCHYHRM